MTLYFTRNASSKRRAARAALAAFAVFCSYTALALCCNLAFADEKETTSIAKSWQIKGAISALDYPDDEVRKEALKQLVEWNAASEIPKERWERVELWTKDPASP